MNCQKYQISYDLMTRLNYYDLQYLVTEHQILLLKENLRQISLARQEANNVEVVNATNEDILRMHPRGDLNGRS